MFLHLHLLYNVTLFSRERQEEENKCFVSLFQVFVLTHGVRLVDEGLRARFKAAYPVIEVQPLSTPRATAAAETDSNNTAQVKSPFTSATDIKQQATQFLESTPQRGYALSDRNAMTTEVETTGYLFSIDYVVIMRGRDDTANAALLALTKWSRIDDKMVENLPRVVVACFHHIYFPTCILCDGFFSSCIICTIV